ncbi:MAG: hypothetical protein HZA02_06915 [Nitrospinae bacterium]|nr:hypothetical protein [Nitrospinota bacterium]
MNFRVVDYSIGVFSGAVAGFAVSVTIPEHLNMIWGMILGNLVGMALSIVLSLLLMPFFGSFEVMVPLHLIGMFVGMTGGMAATIPGVPSPSLAIGGGIAGGVIAAIVRYSDRKLTLPR